MEKFITKPTGSKLVYDHGVSNDSSCAVVFLPGFMSNRQGTKAQFLKEFCAEKKLEYVGIDYRGHGDSEGEFSELTLSDWVEDCLDVLETLKKPLILVGSSMGGWIALRLQEMLRDKVKGLVLLAPAPDFTVRLRESFSKKQLQDLEEKGFVSLDSGYEQPHVFTKKLLDDGEGNLVLERGLELGCPVEILQGKQDTSVPWREALELVESIKAPEITLTLLEEADHGLSRSEDLERLAKVVSRCVRD